MPKERGTDARLAVRMLVKKFRADQKELHRVCVDAEKVQGGTVVLSEGEKTQKTQEHRAPSTEHRASGPSPFLLAVVMDGLVMFADDAVICSGSRWRKTWRGGGLKWKEEE